MSKCVVDTNVPLVANCALDAEVPPELYACVLACVKEVERIIKKGGLVLDADGEIFSEYQHKLSLKGQPGLGDRFLKWVHDNQWGFPEEDHVKITENGDTYCEFPQHAGLRTFDRSDRKFVAVANAHPAKPPILQATDSKWWGWKDALSQVGITVRFLCPDYVEKKYKEKMES
jgi:hypothetical protein